MLQREISIVNAVNSAVTHRPVSAKNFCFMVKKTPSIYKFVLIFYLLNFSISYI